MSRLAQERQGGPLVSHYTISFIKIIERYVYGERRDTLTLRILQASQALRSLVLLVSMETMTQWGLSHASGHDQDDILGANRRKDETSITRSIECLDGSGRPG